MWQQEQVDETAPEALLPSTGDKPVDSPSDANNKRVHFDVTQDAPERMTDTLRPRPKRIKKQPTKLQDEYDHYYKKQERPLLPKPKIPPPPPKTSTILSNLRKSRDRLMFIAYQPVGSAVTNWYLVQALLSNPDAFKEAARTGNLTVNFMIPHHQDTKSKIRRRCRYWPEVHEVSPGMNTFQRIIPIMPSKCVTTIARSNG